VKKYVVVLHKTLKAYEKGVKPEVNRPYERKTVDERIILKCVLKEDMRVWSRFNWFRTGSIAVCCEHCNQPHVSISGRKYLEQMNH
jgi:hypothetical protein